MAMTSIAASRRRQELQKQPLYLTDIAGLNKIYRAAKVLLTQPDKFALERLSKVISQAEGEEQ